MDIASSSTVDHVMDVGGLSKSKTDVPILSGATSSSTAVCTTGVGDLVEPSKSPSELSSELMEPDDDPELDDDATSIAADVLEAAPMIFPCKIRYLDLTVLGLKDRPRVPILMQIRPDWESMMQILRECQKGSEGTIVITGQPGIGQHVYPSFTIVA